MKQPRNPQDMRPTEQVGAQFKQLTDDLSRLVSEHIELAKAELAHTVISTGKDIAFVAVGGVFVAIGYILLACTASIGLGNVVGMALGFLIVACLHLIVGLGLAVLFAKRLTAKDKPTMAVTTHALVEDARFARNMAGLLRNARDDSPGETTHEQERTAGDSPGHRPYPAGHRPLASGATEQRLDGH